MPKILVCDDDRDIVSALRIYLEAENYEVVSASNGLEALSALRNDDEIALVLLDIMMPELDGISTLARLREEKNHPVILLGLNVGADDYVTKPFNPVELSARVRSQLRRYLQLGGSEQKAETLRGGAVSLDDRCKEVRVDGELINLTPREYEILKLLMQHAGEVFRPEEIYRRVWQDEPYGSEGTVAVHIRKLREKTEITPAEPRYLKTVWGQGYKFEAAERRREP